jgi:AraC-like DNA-binding protein
MSRPVSSIALTVRAHQGVLVESYAYSVGTVEPLARHLHPTWQLAWSPDATGEHWVRGSTRVAPPRAISVIPPGEVHAPSQQTWVEAPSSFMMAYLDEDYMDQVMSDGREPGRGTPTLQSIVIASDSILSRLFARAHRLSFDGDPLARDTVWRAVVTRMLTRHVHRRLAPVRATREPRAVNAALEFLHAWPYRPTTLAELARVAKVTPARLCRAFSRQIGLPPHAYHVRMRIERAKMLLLRGHPVSDVAAVTGFADQSHLGRHFKRIVGMAPAAYQAARGRAAESTVFRLPTISF